MSGDRQSCPPVGNTRGIPPAAASTCIGSRVPGTPTSNVSSTSQRSTRRRTGSAAGGFTPSRDPVTVRGARVQALQDISATRRPRSRDRGAPGRNDVAPGFPRIISNGSVLLIYGSPMATWQAPQRPCIRHDADQNLHGCTSVLARPAGWLGYAPVRVGVGAWGRSCLEPGPDRRREPRRGSSSILILDLNRPRMTGEGEPRSMDSDRSLGEAGSVGAVAGVASG